MNETNIQTFSQIYCLLEFFPKSYIEKLPKQLLSLIEQNSNSKYFIDVDITKPLEEQNISEETKDTLVVFKYNYWADETEKKNIIEKLVRNENKYQEELREKYNPDNIFKKKEETIIKDNIKQDENLKMIKYEESIFKKVINKILRFLHLK